MVEMVSPAPFALDRDREDCQRDELAAAKRESEALGRAYERAPKLRQQLYGPTQVWSRPAAAQVAKSIS